METLARSANRGSVSTGYDIDNSLKLEADNSESIYKNNSNGNRRTFTSSLWVKLSELSNAQILVHGVVTNATRLFINSNEIYIDLSDNTSTFYRWRTNAVFRDTSAWYHFVWRVDTTDSTAANRMRFYINGEEYTDWQSSATVPQNFDTLANYVHGSTSDDVQFSYKEASLYNSLYLAEVHHVDGQSLAPTEFGEFDNNTGIWKPKEYTGTYGTNGFYLDFEDSSNLGNDANGGTDFTLSNITAADQATDTPTNNFCTMTSVANFYRAPQTKNATNGGTLITDSNVTNNWTGTMCTTPLFTGKWYWEVYMFQPAEQMCGIHDFNGDVGSNANPYQVAGAQSWVVYGGGAYWIKSIDGTSTNGGTETQFSNNTIVGVALDLDNHLLTFYENGGSAGTNLTNIDISSVTNTYPGPWMPFVGIFRNSLETNFGGFPGFTIASGNTDENGYGNFEYAPPSGFLAICSKNLAES